jgi:hypothetical protein
MATSSSFAYLDGASMRAGGPLIGDWIFRGPVEVREWLDRVNDHGLLDSPSESASLVGAYGKAAERGEAEEIPTPEWTPIVLRIGLVKTDGARSFQG